MSGKVEQLRHRFDQSLEKPLNIMNRSGDSEEGDTLGSLLRDDSATAEELLFAGEDREPRIKFLRKFFALLKQILSPEEFKFIKLRYTKKKTDSQIAVWLGFKGASGVFKSIREKLRREERTIRRLSERSDWDGAEIFVKAISESVNELSKDVTTLYAEPMQKSGFAAFMRAQEIASEREKKPQEYKIHRRFYMRGFYHGTQIQEETEPLFEKIRLKLYGLLGYIDAMRAYAENETPEELEFYQGMRRDIREYMEMIKALSIFTKEEFFENLAAQILGEDLDGNKSFSERCAEKREREESRFEFVYSQPLVTKSIKRVNVQNKTQGLPGVE